MFTLNHYRATPVAGYEEKEWALEKVRAFLDERGGSGCVWGLGNRSLRALVACAAQALSSKEMPKRAQMLTTTDASYWTIRDGKAHLETKVSYQLHVLTKGKVVWFEIAKQRYNRYTQNIPRFCMESTTIPRNDYPGMYSGYDILKHFKNSIMSTAPLLQNLMSAEWRFEDIAMYAGKEIDFVLDQMKAKGFIVDIQAPYLIVEKGRYSEDLCCFARQSISIRIPPDATVSDTAWCKPHPTYKEQLSVHNVLVEARKTTEKIPFPPVVNLSYSLDDAIEKVSTELAFLARHSPLTKRYAFSVGNLTPVQQQELVAQLREVGKYSVTLDSPFIYQQFVGIVNGYQASFFEQYLLIDLP